MIQISARFTINKTEVMATVGAQIAGWVKRQAASGENAR